MELLPLVKELKELRCWRLNLTTTSALTASFVAEDPDRASSPLAEPIATSFTYIVLPLRLHQLILAKGNLYAKVSLYLCLSRCQHSNWNSRPILLLPRLLLVLDILLLTWLIHLLTCYVVERMQLKGKGTTSSTPTVATIFLPQLYLILYYTGLRTERDRQSAQGIELADKARTKLEDYFSTRTHSLDNFYTRLESLSRLDSSTSNAYNWNCPGLLWSQGTYCLVVAWLLLFWQLCFRSWPLVVAWRTLISLHFFYTRRRLLSCTSALATPPMAHLLLY